MRKEETEEQFNEEAKEGWRFHADAARITDERARSEDRKHTSDEAFVAIDSNLGAGGRAEEGAIESIPGNEGTNAQAWVNVRGGLRIFSVYFWHSEGWTPKTEALLEGVLNLACHSFRCKISQMKVVEDFKSVPHKACVLFVVEKETRRDRNGAWLQWRHPARKEHEREAEKKEDKLSKVTCEAGTVHRLYTKKKWKGGGRGTKWQHSGRSRAKIGGDLGTKKDGRTLCALWQSFCCSLGFEPVAILETVLSV